jgi:ribokinase
MREPSHVADVAFVISQLEIPLECVFEAAELARSKGAMFILDPAPPFELEVDILRANSNEAFVLTGIEAQNCVGARRAAEELRPT